jgi:hypothetical protein
MLVLRSKPHEHILGRSVGKDHSRVALGSARPNANKSCRERYWTSGVGRCKGRRVVVPSYEIIRYFDFSRYIVFNMLLNIHHVLVSSLIVTMCVPPLLFGTVLLIKQRPEELFSTLYQLYLICLKILIKSSFIKKDV